jgi:hypothetical protein
MRPSGPLSLFIFPGDVAEFLDRGFAEIAEVHLQMSFLGPEP